MSHEQLSLMLRMVSGFSRVIPEGLKAQIYRVPVLSTSLRRILTGAAPSGFVTAKVAGGLLRGATLRLDLSTPRLRRGPGQTRELRLARQYFNRSW